MESPTEGNRAIFTILYADYSWYNAQACRATSKTTPACCKGGAAIEGLREGKSTETMVSRSDKFALEYLFALTKSLGGLDEKMI